MVCRLIGVSRSGYYRQKRTVNKTQREEAVVNCFNKHKCNYGRIRIRQELKSNNIFISEHSIARILKSNGLKAKSGRVRKHRRPKLTEEQYYQENLVKDKFSVQIPNALWCSDISELKCLNSKLYICGIIDVATRRLVGWAVDKTETQILVQDAFIMAIGRNPNRPEGAIYHSDRGCQYTARKTKHLVESNGFLKSMSRPGKPCDNQPIESFWHTLEIELPDIRHLCFKDAKLEIFKYIELYYNAERLHSGIGYRVPNEFLTFLSVHES